VVGINAGRARAAGHVRENITKYIAENLRTNVRELALFFRVGRGGILGLWKIGFVLRDWPATGGTADIAERIG